MNKESGVHFLKSGAQIFVLNFDSGNFEHKIILTKEVLWAIADCMGVGKARLLENVLGI